jgi:phosphoglycerate dehydrogenase-like enzyme
MTTLSGRTMLVVGMGGIGREIARRAKGFDMTVLATVRTERPAPEYCDELGTAKDLDRFVPLADVVAVALPLTDETTDLFDAEKFALMKPGAYFLNVGRGRIVVTDDLLAALDSGHLAGAGLDVTEPEPLPSDHPLWKSDRVIITPHVSSRAELTGERRWDVFQENMRRFGAGEPLLNLVDKQLGY